MALGPISSATPSRLRELSSQPQRREALELPAPSQLQRASLAENAATQRPARKDTSGDFIFQRSDAAERSAELDELLIQRPEKRGKKGDTENKPALRIGVPIPKDEVLPLLFARQDPNAPDAGFSMESFFAQRAQALQRSAEEARPVTFESAARIAEDRVDPLPTVSSDASLPAVGGELAASEGAAISRPASAPGTRAQKGELSEEDQQTVRQLEARDREVRAHEAAHIAASGGLAGTPSYTYQTGPDGKQYAIGGSVSIDTSPGRTPEETLEKARRVRAAATAPADPSPQDLSVAAQALQLEASARAQQASQRDDFAAQTRGTFTGASAVGQTSSTAETESAPSSPYAVEAQSDGRAPAPTEFEYVSLQTPGGHLHSDMGCAFCTRAVAVYRGAA